MAKEEIIGIQRGVELIMAGLRVLRDEERCTEEDGVRYV